MAKQAITFAGFKKMDNALKRGAKRQVMEKHIGRATGRILKILEAEIRQEIKRGVKPGNAELTISLKGGDHPLKGVTAQLFNSVHGEQTRWDRGFVGVNRKEKTFDLAKNLHNGISIGVTGRMRNMFFLLFLASESNKGRGNMPKLTGRAAELWNLSKTKVFYPLRDDTTSIRIPPRPFITDVVGSQKAKQVAQREWSNALKEMARELAES